MKKKVVGNRTTKICKSQWKNVLALLVPDAACYGIILSRLPHLKLDYCSFSGKNLEVVALIRYM